MQMNETIKKQLINQLQSVADFVNVHGLGKFN